MFSVQSSSSTIDYLSTYDLASKYNLNTVYVTPRLKGVKIQMSLKNFLSQSTHKRISKDLDENIQIKAFFFLYSIFSIVPNVDYYCFKGIKNSRVKEEGDFLLHFTLDDRSFLDFFFLNLLVYNGDFLSATKKFKSLSSSSGNRN